MVAGDGSGDSPIGDDRPRAEPPRTRTIQWVDPAIVAAPSRGMSGIDFLRKIAAGELPPPPIATLVGMRLLSVEPSAATFEFDPAEFMYNPLGSVHGGVIAVLLDSAMGCALQTTLPVGVGYTTLELKVNFVRPVVLSSGSLQAHGRLIHGGSTVSTAEGKLADRTGTLFAHATCTLLVLRGRSPA
jgi:uncharacterized protein (TIGR00369 family)